MVASQRKPPSGDAATAGAAIDLGQMHGRTDMLCSKLENTVAAFLLVSLKFSPAADGWPVFGFSYFALIVKGGFSLEM